MAVTVATLTIATTFLFILVTIIEYTRSKADERMVKRVGDLLDKLAEVESKVAELEEPRQDLYMPSNRSDIWVTSAKPTTGRDTITRVDRNPVDRRTIIQGLVDDMPPLHETPPVVTKPTNLCKDDFKGPHTAPNGVKYTLKSVVIDPDKKR